MDMPTPFDDLGKEHQTLEADAAALRAMALRLSASPEASLDAARAHLLARLRAFRLDFRIHCRREEECLYPEARQVAVTGILSDQGLARFLDGEAEEDLSAHLGIARRLSEVAALLEAVEEAGRLAEEDLVRLRAMLGSALTVLEHHVRKEETMVYPVLRRCLTPAQLAAVQQRLWAMPVAHEGLASPAAEGDPEPDLPGW